jgi:phage terminase small subunit
LTPQQLKQQEKLFIKSILKGMSTQEAALIAGYPQNPSDLGVALMSNPHIRNTIESHWADILHNEGINMLNVVREIAHIALFDPRALINPETGKYIPLHLLPRNVAAAVDSLDMEETEFNDVSTVTRVKYKLSNKLKALQQLGEYLGLFNQTQRVEVTGKDGAPIQMEVQMSPTEIARRVAFVLQQAPEVVDAVESTE